MINNSVERVHYKHFPFCFNHIFFLLLLLLRYLHPLIGLFHNHTMSLCIPSLYLKSFLIHIYCLVRHSQASILRSNRLIIVKLSIQRNSIQCYTVSSTINPAFARSKIKMFKTNNYEMMRVMLSIHFQFILSFFFRIYLNLTRCFHYQ